MKCPEATEEEAVCTDPFYPLSSSSESNIHKIEHDFFHSILM